MPDDDHVYQDDNWEGRAGGRMLLYVGPFLHQNLRQADVRTLVKGKGALGAMWSYDWDCGVEGPWYEHICDTPDYDVDKIPSGNTRKLVRRGIKRCSLRRLDADWLAEHGYQTHVNASARYANYDVESAASFAAHIRRLGKRSNLEVHGVFVDDDLAAFGMVLVYDEVAMFCTAKFDPAYSSSYPMYALYHGLTHLYLRERGLKLIAAGARPLVHDTNFTEFCLRIGWRKAYCRLGLYLTPRLGAALAIARVLGRTTRVLLPARHSANLQGLLLARDIARTTTPSAR